MSPNLGKTGDVASSPNSGPFVPDEVEWRTRDGAPISCREKLKVLEENRAELAQAMRDAFDDAILMDVDEHAMRRILQDMVTALRSPSVRASR